MDVLSQWVYDLFKDVPNRDVPVPSYPTRLLLPQNLEQIISAKPVKDIKRVEVNFVAPDMDPYWDSKPGHYLSHLIGHEGSGSLLAYLKSKGWANELSAGSHTVSKDNGFFSISIDLTDEGIANYEDVVISVFQYIEMLKKELPQEWVFQELRDTAEASFKFQQKGHPASTVSALSKALEKEYIPVGDILSASLLRKYDPELISEYVAELKPENSRVTLIHKNATTDSVEKWYGTEYAITRYTDSLVERMKSPGRNAQLHLPRPNEFISSNFDVEKLENVEPRQEPLLLLQDGQSRLWYKKDDRFWVPKGHIYVSMKLVHTYSSIVNSMLTSLYVDLVNDFLKDIQYDSQVASLTVSFRKTNQGLDLALSGYNEKMPILLTSYLEGISRFKPNQERFKIFQAKLIQKLNNHLYEIPYSQASDVYNSLINERSWTIKDKLEVVEQLTFQHLENFLPTIFEQFFFEALVHGNFSYETAVEIHKLVKALAPNDIKNCLLKSSKPRSLHIPPGRAYYYEQRLADEKNINSCIQHVNQFGTYSEELAAKAALFAQLIDEPAFDTLRTKEQLGYVVFSSALNTHGTVNLRILIQSERDTAFLESRIDAFLAKMGQILQDMSEEEFERHRTALCKTLLQRYKNLSEENSRFTTAIYIGDYNFLNKERKAALVERLSKTDMLQFYNSFVVSKDASKLVIHLKSQAITEEQKSKDHIDGYPTGELISDIGTFQSKQSLAPVRQPIKKFEVTPKL